MNKINFKVKVRCWKDKSTFDWIIYSKKYDVSAYGNTKSKALEMFNFMISQILIDSRPRPCTAPKIKYK